MAPARAPGRRRAAAAAPLLRLLGLGGAGAGALLAARPIQCWVSGAAVDLWRGSRGAAVARHAEGVVGPVVDESDFELEDDKKVVTDKQSKQLESILEAADRFALKKDKKKKQSTALSLEDDLKGLSLEDDGDLTKGMVKAARSGKVDISLEGRLSAWAKESKELVQNPTPIQFTYVTVFFSSVALLFFVGVVTVGMGAVHTRGDNYAEQLRLKYEQDPYMQRMQIQAWNKKRAMEAEEIRSLALDPKWVEKNKPLGDPGDGRTEDYRKRMAALASQLEAKGVEAPPPTALYDREAEEAAEKAAAAAAAAARAAAEASAAEAGQAAAALAAVGPVAAP